MTAAAHAGVDGLLAVAALACWFGVLGMWRMRKPIQSLQYVALPGAVGSLVLTLAVAFQTGASSATAKCVAIALILIAINSIVTHATARAFRVREVGHWEPRPGDGIEFLKQEPKP